MRKTHSKNQELTIAGNLARFVHDFGYMTNREDHSLFFFVGLGWCVRDRKGWTFFAIAPATRQPVQPFMMLHDSRLKFRTRGVLKNIPNPSFYALQHPQVCAEKRAILAWSDVSAFGKNIQAMIRLAESDPAFCVRNYQRGEPDRSVSAARDHVCNVLNWTPSRIYHEQKETAPTAGTTPRRSTANTNGGPDNEQRHQTKTPHARGHERSDRSRDSSVARNQGNTQRAQKSAARTARRRVDQSGGPDQTGLKILPPKLTAAEVAKLMRVTVGTVYRRHLGGHGPQPIKSGGRLLYDRDGVLKAIGLS